MTRNLVFPGFNPLTGSPAVRLSVSERRFFDMNSSFIQCYLDDGDKSHIYLYTKASHFPGRSGRETLIAFDWAMSPTWEVYHERPFPFNDIWIGARVEVEFGFEMVTDAQPHIGRIPTGTNATGVITSLTDQKYVIQYDEPQVSALTSIGYGPDDQGSFYPFQLKLQTINSPMEQYFYEWLSAVTERACDPNKKETIENFVNNWLAQDGGKLMRRIYEDGPDGEEVTGSIGWYMGDAKTADERAALLKEWFNE